MREFKVVALYAALSFLWLLPASLQPATLLPSGPYSDASQALWLMETYEWNGPRFSDQSYPPHGVKFDYIDWVVAPAILSSTLCSLFGSIFTYNLLLWLSLTLCGYGAYRLARFFELPIESAIFCGGAFAVCPALAGQIVLGHLFYVVGATLIAPYLLALWTSLRAEQPALPMGLLLLTWALMLRTCHYYALYLIPLSFVIAIWEIWVDGRGRFRNALTLLVTGVIVSVASVLSVLKTSIDTGFTLHRLNVEFYDADLLGWLTPSPYHPLWGEAFYRSGDRVVFSGFVLLILGAVALRRVHKLLPLLWVVTSVMALGPALYVNGHRVGAFPWSRVFELPAYEAVQVWARAGLISHLILCLMAAHLIKRGKSMWLLSALVLFEFLLVPIPVLDTRPAEPFRELKKQPVGTVLYLPYEAANTEPLYYWTLHRHSIVRSALLRPSPQFLQFYDHFPWLRALTRKDGYKELPNQEPYRFRNLTGLRYIAVDKQRLSDEQQEGWEQAISERLEVANRWENDAFLILGLKELEPKLIPTELSFESDDSGASFWKLKKTKANLSRQTREIDGERAEIYLPVGTKAAQALKIVSRSERSVPTLVFWNGEALGSLVGSPEWTTTALKIEADKVNAGPNKLELVLPPGQDGGVFLDHLKLSPQ